MERAVFILGASSDIGAALMERYLAGGASVIGTYRTSNDKIAALATHKKALLVELDLSRPEAFPSITEEFRERGLSWDTYIASNGTMEPIGPFLDLDGESWANSITANAIAPCRLLQHLYPVRRQDRECSAVFMAGGGTNNPFTNYSAYCLSKIMLIKMCELLDDEAPDLKSFIFGPGYVRTKIHEETLRAGKNAGGNLERTREFLDTDGTSMSEIFDFIEWGVAQPRAVVGGRNLSVVHDAWRDGGADLAARLLADPDMYKLRRAGNT